MKKALLFLIIAVLAVSFSIGAMAAGELSCFPADAKVSLSAQDMQEMNDLLIDYAAFRSASFTGERTMMAGDSRFSEMAAEEADRSVKIREKNISIGLDVQSADTDMRVNAASYDEQGLIKLEVYEWTEFNYDDMTDDRTTSDMSAIGIYHVMLVDPETNVICFDAYDEGPATGMVSKDFSAKFGDPLWVRQSKLSKETYQDFIENGEESEDDRRLMFEYWDAYDPQACVAYADAFVYHGAAGGTCYESYYNGAYTNFNPLGGDCANYTSQSINAGGMPQVRCNLYGVDGWFYVHSGDRSGSWTGAWHLRYYMKNYRGNVVDNPSDAQVFMGSPCFYDWDYAPDDTAYDHATICVGTNSAGRAIINSHNYDYYHYVFNYGGYISTVQLTRVNGGRPFRSTIDDPTPDEVVSGVETEIRGWAIGPKPMKEIYYTIDGGETKYVIPFDTRPDVSQAYPGYTETNNGFSGVIDLRGLSNGSHTIKITAIDEENKTYDVGSRTIKVEGNPILKLTSPGSVSDTDHVKIEGTLTYESGTISKVTGFVNGEPVDVTFDGENVEGTIDLSSWQAGTHTLEIVATLQDDIEFPFVHTFKTTTRKEGITPISQMLLSGYSYGAEDSLVVPFVNSDNVPYPQITLDGFDLTTRNQNGFVTAMKDFALPHTISFTLHDVAMGENYTNGIYASAFSHEDDTAKSESGLWFEFSSTGVGVRLTTGNDSFIKESGHTGDLYKADFAGSTPVAVSIVNKEAQTELYIDGELAIVLKASDGSAISENDIIQVYSYENGSSKLTNTLVLNDTPDTGRSAAVYACGMITSAVLDNYAISEGVNETPFSMGNGVSVSVEENLITLYVGSAVSEENILLEKPMSVREMLVDGESIANRLFQVKDDETHTVTIDGITYNMVIKESRAETGKFVRNEGFTLYGNTTAMPAGWKVFTGKIATNGTYLYTNDDVSSSGSHPCLYTTVRASRNHTFSADIMNVTDKTGNGTNTVFLGIRCKDNTNWATTMHGIWIKMNHDTFWLVDKSLGIGDGVSETVVSGVDFNSQFHTVRVFDDGATATLSVRTIDGAWTDVYRFTGLESSKTSYTYENLITGDKGTLGIDSEGYASADQGFYALWRHSDDTDKGLISELRMKNLTLDTTMGEVPVPRIQPNFNDFRFVDAVSGYSCVESWKVGELVFSNTEDYKGMYYPLDVTLKPGYTMEETLLAPIVNINVDAKLVEDGDKTFLILSDDSGTVSARYLLNVTEQAAEDTMVTRLAFNKGIINPILNTAEVNVTYLNRTANAVEGTFYVAFYDADGRFVSIDSRKVELSGNEKKNIDVVLDLPEGATSCKVMSFEKDRLAPMGFTDTVE